MNEVEQTAEPNSTLPVFDEHRGKNYAGCMLRAQLR